MIFRAAGGEKVLASRDSWCPVFQILPVRTPNTRRHAIKGAWLPILKSSAV